MAKSRKCGNMWTFAGLHMWYKAEFEKFGWMLLAKHKRMYAKVDQYKNTLVKLKEGIACKHATVHERDRKDDLAILLDHVTILCAQAHKIL